MVGAPVRLSLRTRVTTLHTGSNQTIQSTKPSPDLQPKQGRAEKDPGGHRPGKVCGVCHICREVTYPSFYREDPWLLQAVRAEAGGCSRPRRQGGPHSVSTGPGVH